MKTHMIIHHSATADGRTFSHAAIRRYHLSRGWRDIGYHLVVELVGNRYGSHYEAIVGRPTLARAAAAWQQRMNQLGFHVCFVGNYDDEPPPPEMLDFAAPILSDICDLLEIPTDRVIGHRDILGVTKTCPGQAFDLADLRQRIRGA